MTTVAFLDLREMGQRMARSLAATPTTLVVWNQSGLPRELDDIEARALGLGAENITAVAKAIAENAPSRGPFLHILCTQKKRLS